MNSCFYSKISDKLTIKEFNLIMKILTIEEFKILIKVIKEELLTKEEFNILKKLERSNKISHLTPILNHLNNQIHGTGQMLFGIDFADEDFKNKKYQQIMIFKGIFLDQSDISNIFYEIILGIDQSHYSDINKEKILRK